MPSGVLGLAKTLHHVRRAAADGVEFAGTRQLEMHQVRGVGHEIAGRIGDFHRHKRQVLAIGADGGAVNDEQDFPRWIDRAQNFGGNNLPFVESDGLEFAGCVGRFEMRRQSAAVDLLATNFLAVQLEPHRVASRIDVDLHRLAFIAGPGPACQFIRPSPAADGFTAAFGYRAMHEHLQWT